jgi:Xaa-Pro aminopeptidase
MMSFVPFKPSVYQQRRERLMAEVGDDALVAISAAPIRMRNGDSPYPYRQDSDFYYLTGLHEPEAVLVLTPGEKHQTTLFLRPKDRERERWDGQRLGVEDACERLGVDQAFEIGLLDKTLPKLMTNRQSLYYLMGQNASFEQHLNDLRNELLSEANGSGAPTTVMSLQPLLHEQRLIKSPDELRYMRKAAQISSEAMMAAMRYAAHATNEAHLHAELIHVYAQHQAVCAYQPIVAGGENALVLHYVENNQDLKANELILIDAGCELAGYAADISRTFPKKGRFTMAQKALYEVVLAAQLAAIDQVRIGRSYHDFHLKAIEVLTEGLINLGLLRGSLADNLEQETYRRFYMHKTGHWLGLDVHDVGDYRIDEEWRVLERNMVLTVEPGLYIDTLEDIPEEFRGIGIRIEDDIRVSRDEPEVLTTSAPKTVDEIEALMQ